MPRNLGTRQQQNFEKERIDQGSDTRSSQQDPGMTKRVSGVSITFTATQITAAANTFANFAVGDCILVEGTNVNNGRKIVTATDASTYLTTDPPPNSADGTIASGVVIRSV